MTRCGNGAAATRQRAEQTTPFTILAIPSYEGFTTNWSAPSQAHDHPGRLRPHPRVGSNLNRRRGSVSHRRRHVLTAGLERSDVAHFDVRVVPAGARKDPADPLVAESDGEPPA